jgi:hypothetical protein
MSTQEKRSFYPSMTCVDIPFLQRKLFGLGLTCAYVSAGFSICFCWRGVRTAVTGRKSRPAYKVSSRLGLRPNVMTASASFNSRSEADWRKSTLSGHFAYDPTQPLASSALVPEYGQTLDRPPTRMSARVNDAFRS